MIRYWFTPSVPRILKFHSLLHTLKCLTLQPNCFILISTSIFWNASIFVLLIYARNSTLFIQLILNIIRRLQISRIFLFAFLYLQCRSQLLKLHSEHAEFEKHLSSDLVWIFKLINKYLLSRLLTTWKWRNFSALYLNPHIYGMYVLYMLNRKYFRSISSISFSPS